MWQKHDSFIHSYLALFSCDLGSEIINQGIELQTELGANAQDILLRGEAIPEDVCAKVLLDKISSPEVAHHGIVITLTLNVYSRARSWFDLILKSQ